MLWGCVATGGTEHIVQVKERMDSTKYQESLEANIQRSVQTLKFDERLGIPSRQRSQAYLEINHGVPPWKTDKGFGNGHHSPQT